MDGKTIIEKLRLDYPECLTADGYDDAAIGIVVGPCRHPVVCYDYDKCVELLLEDGDMSEREAEEHIEFNLVGGVVGEYTPLFLHDWRKRGK